MKCFLRNFFQEILEIFKGTVTILTNFHGRTELEFLLKSFWEIPENCLQRNFWRTKLNT